MQPALSECVREDAVLMNELADRRKKQTETQRGGRHDFCAQMSVAKRRGSG